MIKTCAILFVFLLPCLGIGLTNTNQNMTLEEKVGQLLIVHFHGEIANQDAKTLIQDLHVGGIIYYTWANGLQSPEQVQILSAGLQEMAQQNNNPVPLFIAVDQEGGIVSRLNHGFTVFPGNKALGITEDPDLTEYVARAIGEELYAVGINMNLAPVVDVNTNPRNPIIGVRSYSDSPETVCLHGKKAVEGYKQANIIATLKHFPGHGDVTTDSHTDLPTVLKSMEELEENELFPFAKLASSVDSIMTAHILIPALDKDHCATLSKTTLTYLRENLGFTGIIIADSLMMQGALKQCQNIADAAIQALNAGCDILLLGGRHLNLGNSSRELSISDIEWIHESIIDAIKCGKVSEDRLSQAVENILKVKNKYISSRMKGAIDFQKTIDLIEHKALAQKVATLSLKKIGNGPVLSLNELKVLVIAPEVLRSVIEKTSLDTIGKISDFNYLTQLNPSDLERETILKKTQGSDLIVFCSYNAWENPAQQILIHSLLNAGKPLILVVSRDPLDADLFPNANLIFITFSPSIPSIQAVCDSIKTALPSF